ncbi:MAG TPA: FlgD immunoglobulin-like domain containing protein [bacterium]|nr:FlgD immunoglobulin-like domain containing protein [bacterium]
MPDDLIEKFFKADLTESEEADLGERLKSSTEEALRFGARAEERYRAYGLPEPQLAKPLALPGTRSPLSWMHLGLKALAALLALALASVVVFGLWRAFAPPADSGAPDLNASAPPVSGAEPTVVAPQRWPRALAPVLTPVDLSRSPGRALSSLSIRVEKAQAGPVTVEVLNLEGAPLVKLYQGDLAAGLWGFEWNGRLKDGSAAKSGYYQIQLDSDSGPQKKIIQIQ